jgi:8-oxo-dGTP pyrophosphatase MutT (NUDIX family)
MVSGQVMATEPAPEPRAAATVLLVRRRGKDASVLMGMRGAAAAFMPSKYVFPGGGLDAEDSTTDLAAGLGETCLTRLDQNAPSGLGHALAAAALRETWEETGLILGEKSPWARPANWDGFASESFYPSAAGLRFFFRAITPPGRPRRFDARFFLADAATLAVDPDDFSRASDELSHLHWVPIGEARQLNLPFITEVVLAELGAMLHDLPDDAPLPAPQSVPFFDNSGPIPTFRRLI